MDTIKQCCSNTCAVAAVAMVTGISYDEVLAVAIRQGLELGAKRGISIGDVVYGMGWRMDWTPGYEEHERSIVSVKSVNQDGLHAVVYHEGEVLDPSTQKQVTLQHVRDTATYTFFNIRKQEKYHGKRNNDK